MASVAYGWAGAVMPFKLLFGRNFDSVTDGRTDHSVTYRVACMGLIQYVGPISTIAKEIKKKYFKGLKSSFC